jgi:hypothetical protein
LERAGIGWKQRRRELEEKKKKRGSAQTYKWRLCADLFTSSTALFKIGKGFEFKKSDEPSRFSFEVRFINRTSSFPIFI